jgi:serine/threonine protein kinase
MLKSTESLTAIGYYIASQIFIQILKGVNHLHKQNPPLIHRDLKPANILLKVGPPNINWEYILSNKEAKSTFRLGIRFCVKIADIGLAVIHKYSGESHTMDRGTPEYTAPEVRDGKKYDTKVDVYSLGVIFKKLFHFETLE